MFQRAGRFAFLFEAQISLLVATGVQHLDGDNLSGETLARLVHRAHPTLTEQLLQFKAVSERAAGQKSLALHRDQ